MPKCLVISGNGDSEEATKALKGICETIPSGNGQEGIGAIGRYRPGLIILYYHPEMESDIPAFRAVQYLCQSPNSSVKIIVVSSDPGSVELMLGKVDSRRCKVLTNPSAQELGQAVAELLKSEDHRRSFSPKKITQAILA